jgi:hypothetical protein
MDPKHRSRSKELLAKAAVPVAHPDPAATTAFIPLPSNVNPEPMPVQEPQTRAEPLPETTPVRGKIARDILLALIPLGIAQGYSMSGFPPTIVGAIVCWIATATLLSHAAWIGFPRVNRWIRGIGLCVLYGVVVWLLWVPVQGEYRKEHGPSPSMEPSPEESAEISQLDSIFAGKDETQLRAYFGFPEMVDTNIAMNKARRVHYAETGNPDMELVP